MVAILEITKAQQARAEELADKEVERFNHPDSWFQYEFRKCGNIGFQAGYLAALADVEKLVEVLERARDVVEFCYMGERDTNKHVLEIRKALREWRGEE